MEYPSSGSRISRFEKPLSINKVFPKETTWRVRTAGLANMESADPGTVLASPTAIFPESPRQGKA
jgi:hypothetical protein